MFFNVKLAYYRAIRELLFTQGRELDMPRMQDKLQLSEEQAQDLAKKLEAPCVLAKAGGSEHLRSSIEEAMRNTWFSMDDMLTASARVTKPGDLLSVGRLHLLSAICSGTQGNPQQARRSG